MFFFILSYTECAKCVQTLNSSAIDYKYTKYSINQSVKYFIIDIGRLDKTRTNHGDISNSLGNQRRSAFNSKDD